MIQEPVPYDGGYHIYAHNGTHLGNVVPVEGGYVFEPTGAAVSSDDLDQITLFISSLTEAGVEIETEPPPVIEEDTGNPSSPVWEDDKNKKPKRTLDKDWS